MDIGPKGAKQLLERQAKVRINEKACWWVTEHLRSKIIPVDREESELPELNKDLIPNFYFYVVGICHQTSPLGLPPAEGTVAGKHRIGWDFLWSKFEQACISDPTRLSPDSWAKETPELFVKTFSDEKLGFRLSDLEGRICLIRDMGERLIAANARSVQTIYDLCEGRVRTGAPNILGELSRFEAYRDPVEKKSIFFLSLMQNTSLWKLADPELLEAPVDYHELRGHLRIGTIEIVDSDLRKAVRLRKNVSEMDDIVIRKATRDVIRLIADNVGITPSQAHYLFWNVFRTICVRDDPKCLSGDTARMLPDRYRTLAGDGCPFARVCGAFSTQVFPVEHQVATQYY